MKCLILGIGGQDGSYLADILLEQGLEVHGLVRHSSADNLWRIRHCLDRLTIHEGDIADHLAVSCLINDLQPNELYNVADQDHVGYSYLNPTVSWDVTFKAAANVMEAVRLYSPTTRMYQPCSSTVFGDAPWPQTEATTFHPLSPYACAKTAAYHAARYYREAHGLFIAQAILYNHDSPRRGPGYLLQEIARKAVACKLGSSDAMVVGDPTAVVDIGYSRDYMEAVVRMVQSVAEPDDYVLASGKARPVGIVAAAALELLELDMPVTTDPNFHRHDGASRLVGDSGKAKQQLVFRPRHDYRDVLRMIITNLMRTA